MPSFPDWELPTSDNAPQYAPEAMTLSLIIWVLPHHKQSPLRSLDALAENTVKIVKDLLKKSKDLHLAFMGYRTPPFPWYGRSPAKQ